jgi:hypothetical protein
VRNAKIFKRQSAPNRRATEDKKRARTRPLLFLAKREPEPPHGQDIDNKICRAG